MVMEGCRDDESKDDHDGDKMLLLVMVRMMMVMTMTVMMMTMMTIMMLGMITDLNDCF